MDTRGAASITTGLAITAIVVMCGFMYWLYQRSSTLEDRVTPVMDGTTAGEAGLGLEEFRVDPNSAIGQRVGLESVPVGTRLGRAAFTLQLDDTLEYPVLLSRDLILRGIDIYGGDQLSLWGNVYALNDSIRGEWVRLGAVEQGSAEQIPLSSSFVLVDSMTIH